MTAADVEWQYVDVPVVGMNDRMDPRVLPPGQFVSVLNGEYSRPGSIRKRPGITQRASGTGGVSVPGADALIKHKREVLMVDADGSTSTPPQLYAHDLSSNGWRAIDELGSATVREETIIADLTRSVVADIGYVNGYLITCMSFGSGVMIIRVQNALSRSIVLESTTRTGGQFPRVATVGGRYAIVTYQNGNTIGARIIDTLPALPTIGSSTTLVTDADAGWEYHDTCGLETVTKFAIGYRQTGAPDRVRILQIGLGLTIDNSTTLGVDPDAISILEVGSRLYVNWWDDAAVSGVGDWRYAVLNASTLASVLASTVYFTPPNAGAHVRRSAISFIDGGNALLLHSELTQDAAAFPQNNHIMRWCAGDTAGVLGSVGEKRGCHIVGKPWQKAPRHHVWVAAGTSGSGATDSAVPTTIYENQLVYALLSLVEGSDYAWLEATAYAGQVPLGIQVAEDPPWSSPFDGSSYHGAADVGYVPLEAVFGPRDLTTTYTHLGRYKNVEFGGITYIANGCVTAWDGARHMEVGFSTKPVFYTELTPAGGGSWAATGEYQYAVLYEAVYPNGQRERSQLSAIQTVTIAAAGNSVTLEIEPYTATRRNWGSFLNDEAPVVTATIFRGQDGILQRLATFPIASYVSRPDLLTTIQFVDLGSAPQSPGEVLYTVSGELVNDMPHGGATTLAVHRDRLWLGGGLDPEVLWYSKPRVDGRPAEFSLEQTIRVADQRVVALESLHDSLIALCEEGIFAIRGEGPGATGIDGFFATPEPIERNIGCVNPRSVVVAAPGLFFQARNGIHLLTSAGGGVSYIGEPVQTTLEAFPRIMAAYVVPSKNQVRFACSSTASDAGRTLVYDYSAQQWAVWRHMDGGDPWVGAVVWDAYSAAPIVTPNHSLLRNVVMLDQRGDLFEETPNNYIDHATTYLMSLETGWLSFGVLSGYLRVRKVYPVVERVGIHGLDITMKFRRDPTATATRSFSSGEITALGAPEAIRVYVPQPKQTSPSIVVRLDETNAAGVDSAGFAVQAFSFEIGRLPGLNRLPAANTK